MAADNSRIPRAAGEAEPGRPELAALARLRKRLRQILGWWGGESAAASPGLPPKKKEPTSPADKCSPPADPNEAGKAPVEVGKAPVEVGKAPVEAVETPAEAGKASTPAQPSSTKPAPASWQNIPATGLWCPAEIGRQWPELAEVVYQDERAQGGKGAGEWLVAGATRRGRLHAHAGTHREDAFAFASGEGYSVVCVADGAGSSKHSRIASEICCREMIRQLQKTLFGNGQPTGGAELESEQERVGRCIGATVKHICQRLRELAAAAGCQARDFHSTLLVAVQIENEGVGKIYISQVGDGAICVLRRTGQVQALELADSGEYSGQVTCFVPDDSAESKARRLHVFEAQEIECLLLCSDGIEDPFYPMQGKARAIFQQLYLGVNESFPEFTQTPQAAPLLQADVSSSLLSWLDFRKRGENDDRTLVALYRAPCAAVAQVLR